jgi:aryl-alcohol dehydrogenase-like predicted oxidoreductase
VRLGLGTVQFGTAYGVSNSAGRTPPTEVERILRFAAENDISLLDTATSYGDAEAVLGLSMSGLPARFDVVTKTPVYQGRRIGREDARELRDALLRSLDHLRQERLYGLLVHHAADLMGEGGRSLVEELQAAVSEGLVQKIGVSVYDAAQLDAVLSVFVPDIVQLPLNALDRRLIASRHLQRLDELGVEVHARSVFLQGAMLMQPERLPRSLSGLSRPLGEFVRLANRRGLSPLQAALKFVLDRPEVDVVLVGVCTLAELREIAGAVAGLPDDGAELEPIAMEADHLLDPSRWQMQADK